MTLEPTRKAHQRHVEASGLISYTIRRIDNELGSIELEICDSCYYIVTHCLHTKCTWHGEYSEDLDTGSQKLLCDLCGIDGT